VLLPDFSYLGNNRIIDHGYSPINSSLFCHAIKLKHGVYEGQVLDKLLNLRPCHDDKKNMNSFRYKIGMTQIQFASSFDISDAAPRHWERGDRTPHGPVASGFELGKNRVTGIPER
jgi:hypothetical protein